MENRRYENDQFGNPERSNRPMKIGLQQEDLDYEGRRRQNPGRSYDEIVVDRERGNYRQEQYGSKQTGHERGAIERKQQNVRDTEYPPSSGRGDFGEDWGERGLPEDVLGEERSSGLSQYRERRYSRYQSPQMRQGGEYSGHLGPQRQTFGYQEEMQSGISQRGIEQQKQQFSSPYNRFKAHDRGKHYGKGPKGFQHSDEDIKREVCTTLARHSDIDASNLEVEVKQGEVILTGFVDSRQTKYLVEDVVEDVMFVREVNNQLRVRREDAVQPSGRTV
jgi:osmotically-inducible protein OsmY